MESRHAVLHLVEVAEVGFVDGQEGSLFAVEVEFDGAGRAVAVLFDEDLGFFLATGLVLV